MVHTFFYINSHFPSLLIQYLSFLLTYDYDFRFLYSSVSLPANC